MKKKMKIPELVAPAGNLSKFKAALEYGADAAYFSGKKYGLRSAANNFSLNEIDEAVRFARERNKKTYVAVNAIPHNRDFTGLPEYIGKLSEIGPDGIIVSDPGLISLVREKYKNLSLVLSTQANTVNYKSAIFWHRAGIKKIVLARELSIKEIEKIIEKSPAALEFEAFIHGSMCISYSGRCYLSGYMTGRNANLGGCTQSCRWSYALMEEKRAGEYFPVYEDKRGSYIMSSKDLCLLARIPELVESGLNSLKIEGRMRSVLYVATVVSVYRKAIDNYLADPSGFRVKPQWIDELKKTSHRPYTEAFFNSAPGGKTQIYEKEPYLANYEFAGVVLEYDKPAKMALIQQKNKLIRGDRIEIIGPQREYFSQRIEKMQDEEGNPLDSASNPNLKIKISIKKEVNPGDLVRKKIIPDKEVLNYGRSTDS